MHTYSFENLQVWQNARQFRRDIYKLTANYPKEEIFGLTSQIRKSASSIGDCLAEGSARITNKDKAHFTTMSYSSAIETVNHIIGSLDLGYIAEEEYKAMRIKLDEITNKLNALRKSQLSK